MLTNKQRVINFLTTLLEWNRKISDVYSPSISLLGILVIIVFGFGYLKGKAININLTLSPFKGYIFIVFGLKVFVSYVVILISDIVKLLK